MPFKKGKSGNPAGKPKGTLNYETLNKLERKAQFDRIAAKKFEEWIERVKPEYGLDQFLGPVKTILEVKTKKDIPDRIRKIAEILKEADK